VVHEGIAKSLSRMWIFYKVFAGVGFLAGPGIWRVELSTVHVEVKTHLKRRDESGDEKTEV